MDCPQQIPDENAAYLKHFNSKMVANRIPVSGSIDLTKQCNFRCIHCYLPPTSDSSAPELSTSQWKAVIDQITEAGCLFLLITGGEPLFRSDFPEIYSYAVQKGLLVTVFSNGALVSDRIIDCFRELPPYVVEITLYGATPETYEHITGHRSHYAKTLAGIDKLYAKHVPFKLKTMLMAPNIHEFENIRATAGAYNTAFRFDAALFGRLNGDRKPMAHRVDPKTAVAMEMADPSIEAEWRDFYHRMKDMPVQDTVYHCGAGITNFHVDACGNLQPCIMTTRLQYNILFSGGFEKGWRQIMPQIRNEKASGDILTCNACEKRFLCAYCPAFFTLENGSALIRSEYLCAQAHYRYHALFSGAELATESLACR